MSTFEQAMQEMQSKILEDLERQVWKRLEPRIQQELLTRHMSISDTAKYLHVSVQTIRRLIRDKTGPSFRIRNQIFIRQMDVDIWIENQIKTGRA